MPDVPRIHHISRPYLKIPMRVTTLVRAIPLGLVGNYIEGAGFVRVSARPETVIKLS